MIGSLLAGAALGGAVKGAAGAGNLLAGARASASFAGKAALKGTSLAARGVNRFPMLRNIGLVAGAGLGTSAVVNSESFNNFIDSTGRRSRGIDFLQANGGFMAGGAAGAALFGKYAVSSLYQGGKAAAYLARNKQVRAAGSMAASASKNVTKKALYHPFIAAAGMGLAAGAASSRFNHRGGISPEGNITGIGQGGGRGISPSLQFSTQGLTLNIHRNRSRVTR
jgi:hypothetical protein